jgi:ribosomal protein S24E
MELTIKEKNDNVFFKRTNVVAEIQHTGEPTPKRENVKKLLAAKCGAEEGLVVIKELKTSLNTTKCTAEVYKDRKDLEKYARKYLLERGTKKEKTPAAEAKEAK